VAALAGAIESTSATEKVQLYFLSKKPGALADEINALLRNHEQLLIGFSFATTNIAHVYRLVTALRGRLAGQRVTYIAGGPHATGVPEGTLALGFDIVVIGEAEESFPELVGALSNGSSFSDLKVVKGIAYTENGAIVKTGRRRPVDVNDFAPFSVRRNRLSPIEISRGCPHACRFCQTSFIFGARMRHRSIQEIVKYIKLSKDNGTKDFRFISPNALAYGSDDGKTVNLEAVETLLREASRVTGKDHLFFGSFPSEVRPEAVSKDALELITGLTATKQLVVGAQTGSQRMLDLLHREHTVEDILNAVGRILKAGLAVSVDFIFGLPGEMEKDRRLSIEMIEKLTGMGAKIHSHTFIPLPGTPLSSREAGNIDEELARYLSRLANKGLQFGQWKRQQQLAEEAATFRREING
jgi:B12-binding domain/radical SAM domain protein